MALPISTRAVSGNSPPWGIDLRNVWLATLLAWFWPGLGHIYQRRIGKGLLFMICILGTFAYGMYVGGGRVVYASTTRPVAEFTKFRERWHYACQVCIGLPALPAYLQTWRMERGLPPLLGDNFMRPPYGLEDLHRRYPVPEIEAQIQQRFQSTDQTGKVVHHADERNRWHHDLAFYYELGTVYTLIAGLMNVLAICDARWGPLILDDVEEPADESA